MAELEAAPAEAGAPSPGPRIVGWIQVVLLELLVSEAGAAVVGLVVDEEHRHLGAGRALIDRAEDWARGHGCRTVVVRSRDHRKSAHAFYQRLGYRHHKTQLAFRKEIDAAEEVTETLPLDSAPGEA